MYATSAEREVSSFEARQQSLAMGRAIVELYNNPDRTAEEIKQLFTDFHSTDDLSETLMEYVWSELQTQYDKKYGASERTVDIALDRILSFDSIADEAAYREQQLAMQKRFHGEQLWFGGYYWTSYATIRAVTKALELDQDDIFYDLGSGYGRAPLYAGLTTPAQAKGIELVPQRVTTATRVADNLGLENVSFIESNILDQYFTDGTAFYMYWPFSRQTHESVMAKLKDVAASHVIRLAVRGPDSLVGGETWLYEEWERNRQLPPGTGAVHFYKSYER